MVDIPFSSNFNMDPTKTFNFNINNPKGITDKSIAREPEKDKKDKPEKGEKAEKGEKGDKTEKGEKIEKGEKK